jgi:hypothetical protein
MPEPETERIQGLKRAVSRLLAIPSVVPFAFLMPTAISAGEEVFGPSPQLMVCVDLSFPVTKPLP